MVRRIFAAAALAALTSAAARAGGGAIAGEVALGFVGGAAGACASVPVLVILTPDNVAFGAVASFATGVGAATGVWLAGEWLDGRSANRGRSFLGALGGASIGAGLAVVCFSLAVADDGHTDENEGTWIPIGLGVLVVVTPVLGTVGYNLAKEPPASDSGGLTVTPAIAALPPRAPGEAPTLTFGLAASF